MLTFSIPSIDTSGKYLALAKEPRFHDSDIRFRALYHVTDDPRSFIISTIVRY
jgi:hypothetical protein